MKLVFVPLLAILSIGCDPRREPTVGEILGQAWFCFLLIVSVIVVVFSFPSPLHKPDNPSSKNVPPKCPRCGSERLAKFCGRCGLLTDEGERALIMRQGPHSREAYDFQK